MEHFIAKHGRAYGFTGKPTAALLKRLQEYPWPGNVRELENFVVRWMTLGEEALDLLDKKVALSFDTSSNRRWLSMTMEEIEAEVIKMFLEDCGRNKTLAAKRLGLARKSLYNKIERYGIEGAVKGKG